MTVLLNVLCATTTAEEPVRDGWHLIRSAVTALFSGLSLTFETGISLSAATHSIN